MINENSPVPRLGLGTWRNTDFEQCRESVRTALDLGYQHIDTAEQYENERAIGAAIDAADVDRDDVYLVTKVLHPHYFKGGLTREKIRTAVESCLSRLQVDTVDLLYVHWPCNYDLELVHTTLADLRDDGLITDVGVSNYEPEHLDVALTTDPNIVANQIELHPLLPQPELREYCSGVDVDVVAYAPLAHGDVFDVPALQQVADDYGGSVAQVALAWLRAKGVAMVPKATSEAHIRDNWRSRKLTLTDADIATIDDIDRTERLFNPDFGPDW